MSYYSTIPNPLPSWQKPIETSSLRRFRNFIKLLAESKDDYPAMGVGYGPAGIGKTVSILASVAELPRRSHTLLPEYALIEIKTKPRPKGLSKQILAALGEKPRGRENYDLQDEIVESIARNDLRLLVFDEADRLDTDTFELIRYICEHSKCPVLLVGLPSIRNVIRPQEKLASRVVLIRPFPLIEEQEALDVYFPGLVFPRWSFDPRNQDDRSMGCEIWRRVQPSLRRARAVVQIADKVARILKDPRITMKHIEEAFTFTPEESWEMLQGSEQNEADEELDPNWGQHERESELRKQEKQQKKRNS